MRHAARQLPSWLIFDVRQKFPMHAVTFTSFEELERYLRAFTTWSGDRCVYDTAGAFSLWRALLENMHMQSVDGEFDDLAKTLSEDQVRLLERMVAAARSG